MHEVLRMYLPDGEFLQFSVSELRPLEKEASNFWYRPLGSAPEVKKGELFLVGHKAVDEDLKEIARGTFLLGGITTLLKRGPDLFVDGGTPFIVVVAADVNISLDKIPLVDISPMCPCGEGNGAEKGEALKAKLVRLGLQ